MITPIEGFSKLSKDEKIEWVAQHCTHDPAQTISLLKQYWNSDPVLQQLHDEFIENTLTNHYLPLGIAPNFLINGKLYAIPMAIEESSVVAAASKAAKFWLKKGGFNAEVINTEKVGQVHLNYYGDPQKINTFFKHIKPILLEDTKSITANMERRGGGILSIELRDQTQRLAGYYQIHATFETLDAMGANFINSCLEQFAHTIRREADLFDDFNKPEDEIEVVMSILSNYVPDCLVKASVACPVDDLAFNGHSGAEFAEKMVRAVQIAHAEPHRAVTHNKGIMNGIDAVVVATGNDFRAVEAGVHAFAAKEGSYTSLTHATIEKGIFKFELEVPMALGTIGGLTALHPLVKTSLEILQKPSAKELMQITAVAGLAQNFAAVSSLVTTGIQEGHMKMHLMNILNQLKATTEEKLSLITEFSDKSISYSTVEQSLLELRKRK